MRPMRDAQNFSKKNWAISGCREKRPLRPVMGTKQGILTIFQYDYREITAILAFVYFSIASISNRLAKVR